MKTPSRSLACLTLAALAATASAQDPILEAPGPIDIGQSSYVNLHGPTGYAYVKYAFGVINPPLSLAYGDLWLAAPRFSFGAGAITGGTSNFFFFTVPSTSSLIGAEAWLEALVNPTAPGPLVLSNGLLIRLGPLASAGPLQNVPFELFGRSLATGDHDADGLDDLVVGVPGATTSAPSLNTAGKVSIYTGSSLSPVTSFAAGAPQGGENFGYSVALAQIDGLFGDDLVVGGPLWDVSGTIVDAGRVHVYLSPSYTPTSGLTGTISFEFFGWKVDGIDFNGDGKDSLVVGAPASLGTGAGSVHVYDFAVGVWTPAYTLVEPAGGQAFGKRFAAGDWSSASGLELAVADPERPGSGFERGAVHVYAGTTPLPTLTSPSPIDYGHFGDGLAAGDFTGDGVDDLVVGAPGEGKVYIYSYTGVAWTLEDTVLQPGAAPSSTFGSDVLAADVDTDGATDLVVGQIGSSGLGRAWVLFGTNGQALSKQLFGVIGHNDTVSTLFGYSLATGDLDGDGDLELYCGAPTTTTGFADSGKVFKATF